MTDIHDAQRSPAASGSRARGSADSSPAGTPGLSRRKLLLSRSLIIVIAAAVLPVAAQLGGGPYVVYAYILGTAFAISVLGSNLIVGFLGEANLAGGAFLALGAYVSVIAASHGLNFIVAAVIGSLVSALLGIVLAIPAARVHGHQLALATLGLAWATPDVINYASNWTGGSQGLYVPASATLAGSAPGSGDLVEAYIVSGVFGVCALLTLVVLHGRFGRLVLAHAEAGPAAKSFGVRTWLIALVAWGACGALGGLSGVFYGHAVGYLSPDEFTFQVSLYIFVGSMIGGARSVPGAWIGGLLAGALPQLLSNVPGGASILVFGAVLALVVVLARTGVYPSAEQLIGKGAALVRRRILGGSR